jgi:hypothetical protein
MALAGFGVKRNQITRIDKIAPLTFRLCFGSPFVSCSITCVVELFRHNYVGIGCFGVVSSTYW